MFFKKDTLPKTFSIILMFKEYPPMSDEIKNLSFNMQGLWAKSSTTNDETLQISVWQGTASFVVFSKKKTGRDAIVAKISLPRAAITIITDFLKTILTSGPETRLPYITKTFVRNQDGKGGTYENADSMTIFRDERKLIGLEIHGPKISNPIKFMLKIPGTMQTGQDMTDQMKSEIDTRTLITVLTHDIPNAIYLSRFNMPPRDQRGGGNRQGGGGGSYNNNSSYNNSDDPF